MDPKLVKRAKELATEIKTLAAKYEGKAIEGDDATKFGELNVELKAIAAQLEGAKLADGVIAFADAPAGDGVKHVAASGEVAHKLSDLLPDWDEYKGLPSEGVSGEIKTMFDATAADTAVPQYLPQADMRRETLRVRDIFGSGTTETDVAKYLKQTLRTDGADFVGVNGPYPESAFKWEWQTDNVVKVGHTLPVADDTLADRGQFSATLDGEMTYGVDLKVDRALLQGDGTGDQVLGLFNRGIQVHTPGADEKNIYDIIRKMVTKASWGSAVGFVPDFVGMDPTIAEALDLQKDATGRYLQYAVDGKVWRLPVVESPAFSVAAHDAVPLTHHITVGAGKVGGQVLSRRGTNVEVGYVNDQFVKDSRTIKASQRLLMRVPYPVAFVDCALTDAALAPFLLAPTLA